MNPLRLAFALFILFVVSEADAAAAPVTYNRDIRPVLSDNCFHCHGPDAAHRKAGLRLDVREEALKAAKSGDPAIVPGDLLKSALWGRINSTDEEEIMPPPKAHKTVTAAQKENLRQWIEQGAKYEPHWAFVPLAPVPLPVVKLGRWPRNPLDVFILARLESEGLTPSAKAEQTTLIRRVSLDLTGLPPTQTEVDGFVSDPSAQAYEKVVERLLNSPHYGERMAVDWLDAARYADTNGYQVDRDREMWSWRDWVIRAFNENKPFDQFTIEQIAGDLLPNATLDQRIATGFNRNHMINEEGGILPEEFMAEYTADRVETTTAVWLAQTFNCCRCHDHKFDPFTQRDFYSLKAFFNNVPEFGKGIRENPIRQSSPPFLKLPTPEDKAKVTGLAAQVQAVAAELVALTDKSSAGVEEWSKRVGASKVRWVAAEILAASGGDEPPQVDETAHVVEIGASEANETKESTIKIRTRLPAGKITALRLECAPMGSAASIRWSELKVARQQPLKLRATATGDSLASTTLATALDQNRKTQVKLDVKPDHSARAVFELEPAIVSAIPVELEIELALESASGPSRWRVSASDAEPDVLVPSNVLAIAKKEANERSNAENKELVVLRLSQQPEHRRLSDRLTALKKQLAAAESDIPTTLVMEEMKAPRPTFVLLRGMYDKPGAAVTAATPVVLPTLSADLPRNRLGLAQWLMSPQNPLTARVIVNRLWQQVFGTGLVKTSEDFGAQGEPPSHPELLDWLAGEFIRSGWNVKHLIRLMVTSATYRQQSQLTPLLRERDPDNRLLARGARYRLMGEFVRDQALAASGLLVPTLGGPSVRPYHPAGLYEQLAATSTDIANTYVRSTGEALHRRSLYTYWKRSIPHPAMLAFGKPFRETCTLQRPRSNTPLQALNLMNDETYVEAARFLTGRMIHEAGESAESRLRHGFRLVLARTPKSTELRILQRAYVRALAAFEKDQTAAVLLLGVGEKTADPQRDRNEIAALTTVAMTILCLDETVTKQ